MAIDHIGLTVRDYESSKHFYEAALKPLGIELLLEVHGFAGFGTKSSSGPIANFWIHQGEPVTAPAHVAFVAPSRAAVDAFYQAALAAGGKDHGEPGIRELYHPNYYGAFVWDPSGHNIEAVCHKPE